MGPAAELLGTSQDFLRRLGEAHLNDLPGSPGDFVASANAARVAVACAPPDRSILWSPPLGVRRLRFRPEVITLAVVVPAVPPVLPRCGGAARRPVLIPRNPRAYTS